ncbi:MAG TPA: serine hydrolase domain-containing protein [Mycobacteriales bacterium]|nr:serine hydrolase domain-containing protein [Mycobacteriales bacterium]
MTTTTSDTEHGYVAAGFEPVRDALVNSAHAGAGGAAFAAYVDGDLTVDLRTGFASPGVAWQPDTLAVLMSVTKSFLAFDVQLLDDRGEIDLDAKVAKYWPEFAAAGKDEVTVRQLMSHTAGAIRVPPQLRLMKGDGEGWDDYKAIAAAIAAEPLAWAPGTRHGYHALTFGWLVGEVVRRITGVSPGTFLRTEVIEPLGLDIHIAATDADLARVAKVITFDPDELGFPQKQLIPRVMTKMTDPTTFAGMAMAGNGDSSLVMQVVDMMEHGGILRAEVMASSGLATAPALARFFSILALGGEVDGRRFVSEASVRKWSQPVITAGDVTITESLPKWMVKLGKLEKTTAVTRTLGYLYNDAPAKGPRWFGPTPTAIGGLGAGGQVAFADPVRRVSGGFVRNAMAHKPDYGNEVIHTFYKCLGTLRS